MSFQPLARRGFLKTLALGGGAMAAFPLFAEELDLAGPMLREPIHRIAKAESAGPANAAPHPLDPALTMARAALGHIRQDINDFEATIIKRERIKGVLGNYEYMYAKIRNRKIEGDQLVVPLSVYLKFLKPKDVEGREVVWVEGQNNNKLRAHEGGVAGKFLPSVWLPPDGAMAMRGNLHPIYDIGIENLVLKLIERGEADRKLGPGDTEVRFIEGAKVNDRLCTVIEVRHPVQKPHFDFYLAQIFLDNEMQVPIRYAAFHWPTDPKDTTGPVLEEYTYLNVKLNVGLEDADFDSNNPNYKF
ncbi:MAG: DUF1571 domain-containing protein [Pirellulaceae bacterium]